MKIDQTALLHLADLSALELDENEQERLVGELNQILVYVERVQNASTTDLAESTLLDFRREDQAHSSETRPLFSLAPELVDQHFCTPLVTDSLEDAKPDGDGNDA